MKTRMRIIASEKGVTRMRIIASKKGIEEGKKENDAKERRDLIIRMSMIKDRVKMAIRTRKRMSRRKGKQ